MDTPGPCEDFRHVSDHLDGKGEGASSPSSPWCLDPHCPVRGCHLAHPAGCQVLPSPEHSLSGTLQERGARYGTFGENSRIAQDLKDVVRQSTNWESMASDQREAIDMILSKISRLTTGNPDYLDNWHDIGGYSQLIEDRLRKG